MRDVVGVGVGDARPVPERAQRAADRPMAGEALDDRSDLALGARRVGADHPMPGGRALGRRHGNRRSRGAAATLRRARPRAQPAAAEQERRQQRRAGERRRCTGDRSRPRSGTGERVGDGECSWSYDVRPDGGGVVPTGGPRRLTPPQWQSCPSELDRFRRRARQRRLLGRRRAIHAPGADRGSRRDRPRRHPVGAVVVRDGEVIATGHNERELRGDPTAHAETIALREAARAVGNWRVLDSVLYVTLEPCVMCAGAIVLSRVPQRRVRRRRPQGGRGRQRAERAGPAPAQPPAAGAVGSAGRGVRRAAARVLRRPPLTRQRRVAAVAATLSYLCTRPTWRGGRAVECAGLENRYGRFRPSGVRIPPSPSSRSASRGARADRRAEPAFRTTGYDPGHVAVRQQAGDRRPGAAQTPVRRRRRPAKREFSTRPT